MNNNILKIFFTSTMLILCISSSLISGQDTIRIACVGNSITEGIIMNSRANDAYPVALGRYLGPGFLVKNCGLSGRTLLKKGDFPLWKETIFSQALSFNPNIVTIALGTNDSKPYNWIYKDEFIHDYIAMIDTFKQLPTHPEIYICLPLPSFSDAFDIRDSIIVADIIPMIKKIADSADVKLIDFNTPFLDKYSLMPDGIHPLIEGSDLMARIIYKALTGNTIEVIKENNVVLYKNAYQGTTIVPELTDGNPKTRVGFKSSSEPVIISLGSEAGVDMIQIHFTDSTWTKISFTLALSTDSLAWTPVADTAISDTALLIDDYMLKYTASFPSANAKFIKLQIKNDGIPGDTTVLINEIKVFESRIVHAPFLGWKTVSLLSTSIRIRLYPKRTTNKGEYLRIYRQLTDGGPFTLLYNYGNTLPANISMTINHGTLNRFYSSVYANGAEITTDTLTIISQKVTDVETKENNMNPLEYKLSQNYPNPFNPTTSIRYILPNRNLIQLKIFDLLGREMQTLVNEEQPAGKYLVNVDASKLSSGVYFYQMQAGNFIETKKLILMK